MFDPFDILTPSILELEVIIQSLWKENLDWDDEIPEELRKWFVKCSVGVNDTKLAASLFFR